MNRKSRILIVEDNESIRRLLETKLDRSGFEVVCADNVVDGRRIVMLRVAMSNH